MTTVADFLTSYENGQELPLETLAWVHGGSGNTVPFNTPQSAEYQTGKAQVQSGQDLFVTGAGMLIGAPALPPPADLGVAGLGVYNMAEGHLRVEQGEAMMAHAQAEYDASQVPPPPPPPTVVEIPPVVITASEGPGGYMENGVMVMDPLVVTAGGGDPGGY